MKRILILLLFIIPTFKTYSQEKIAHKVYSYGQIKNSIKGKTLVKYLVNDPKGEVKIIEKFNDYVEALSWNKLFIPNIKYSDSEFTQTIIENKIETIIVIRINGVGTFNVSQSYSSLNSNNTISSVGTIGKGIQNVNLCIEIYNKSNNFNKPVAVINGEANNSWASSQRGITNIIIKRMLSALEDEKAFVN